MNKYTYMIVSDNLKQKFPVSMGKPKPQKKSTKKSSKKTTKRPEHQYSIDEYFYNLQSGFNLVREKNNKTQLFQPETGTDGKIIFRRWVDW